jgi:penicillin-binding protein 2
LHLVSDPDPHAWQAAISDVRRPFFPRVTQMTIPPGSVFKILTAIALLESGRIDPDEPFFCQGYLDRPDRNRCYIYRHYGVGHGEMTLESAICESCNVYFFHAARELGPGAIAEWAARFGLGAPSGAEVPGEKAGHLPQTDRRGAIIGEQWYGGSTLQLAIGQASLTVTPLQIARMVAAIANDGYLVTPRFVSPSTSEPDTPISSSAPDIRLAAFHSTQSTPSAGRIPALSPGTLQRVREAMFLVVDSPEGTGRRAAVEGIAIAGKTGTAEVGGGRNDHAWFVGFVPAEAPRYAFAVVLEHGGSGGATAAPLAKSFIEAMADAGLLRRTSTAHAARDM